MPVLSSVLPVRVIMPVPSRRPRPTGSIPLQQRSYRWRRCWEAGVGDNVADGLHIRAVDNFVVDIRASAADAGVDVADAASGFRSALRPKPKAALAQQGPTRVPSRARLLAEAKQAEKKAAVLRFQARLMDAKEAVTRARNDHMADVRAAAEAALAGPPHPPLLPPPRPPVRLDAAPGASDEALGGDPRGRPSCASGKKRR